MENRSPAAVKAGVIAEPTTAVSGFTTCRTRWHLPVRTKAMQAIR
jgi:hypothetical protein